MKQFCFLVSIQIRSADIFVRRCGKGAQGGTSREAPSLQFGHRRSGEKTRENRQSSLLGGDFELIDGGVASDRAIDRYRYRMGIVFPPLNRVIAHVWA